MPDTFVTTRTRVPYEGKVHNPRKIFEEKQRAAKAMTQQEFMNSTREMVNKRLVVMEEGFNKLVQVVKDISDTQGHLQASLDELKASLAPKGKKGE